LINGNDYHEPKIGDILVINEKEFVCLECGDPVQNCFECSARTNLSCINFKCDASVRVDKKDVYFVERY